MSVVEGPNQEEAGRGILGQASIGVLQIDHAARIEDARGDVEAVLGLGARDLVGHTLPDPFAGFPSLVRAIDDALAAPRASRFAIHRSRAIELVHQPSDDGAGGVLIAADVTALWSERLAERERKRELDLLLRQIPVAAWATDRELRITSFMGRVASQLQIDPDRIPGLPLQEILGSQDAADPVIAHHLAALAGTSSSLRHRFRGRWYQIHIEPLRQESGPITGCVGAAVDVTERQLAEDRVAVREALMAEAEQVAEVGSWQWDVAANEVTWSDELYRIYGLDPDTFDATYEAFEHNVHPDDLAHTRAVLFEALASAGTFSYEHRIVRPDGTVRQLETRGKVVVDGQGQQRMIGACQDITELCVSRHALEGTISLLEATIESTADGLLVVDREGKISAYNDRFLSLWHLPERLAALGDDGAMIRAVLDQLSDPDAFERGIHALYDRPADESFEVLHFKDGRIYERYSRPQRVRGEIVGRVWSFRDVSERERMYRRAVFLANASRLLGSLDLDTALDRIAHLAVPSLGDGCAIDLFSHGSPRRLLVISRDPARRMLAEVPAPVLAGHAMVRNVEDSSVIAVPFLGRHRVSGAISLLAPPQRTYVQADLEIVTELARRISTAIDSARVLQMTQDAVRAREEFLAVAAHEIRGPLTTILLGVQSLARGLGPQERIVDGLDRESRRLARLVDELMDLGRARTGNLEFVLEPVDVGQIAREVAARLAPEMATSGSSLSLRCDPDATGNWDRSRIDQVIGNLLSNAIKFGLGRPIELAVEAHDSEVVIAVTDHGIGIDPHLQRSIFEPFERAVPERQYGGLGLGLYIVRTIVDGLGGRVEVDTAEGGGSTFRVRLPRQEAS